MAKVTSKLISLLWSTSQRHTVLESTKKSC